MPTASCPEPVLELTASASGTSRSSSLVTAGSSALDSSSSLGTSPSTSSTDGGLGVGFTNRRSSIDSGECTEVLVGAASIREHLQQLNRDVRAREHMRNDEKVGVLGTPRGWGAHKTVGLCARIVWSTIPIRYY